MAQRRLHSEGAAPAARTRAQSPGHASARRLCSLVCSPMEPMHARPVVTSVILKNTFAGLGLGFVPTVHGGISGLHSFWWPVEPHRKLGEILPGHNGNPFRFWRAASAAGGSEQRDMCPREGSAEVWTLGTVLSHGH